MISNLKNITYSTEYIFALTDINKSTINEMFFHNWFITSSLVTTASFFFFLTTIYFLFFRNQYYRIESLKKINSKLEIEIEKIGLTNLSK